MMACAPLEALMNARKTLPLRGASLLASRTSSLGPALELNDLTPRVCSAMCLRRYEFIISCHHPFADLAGETSFSDRKYNVWYRSGPG